MTVGELLRVITAMMSDAGCEDAAFDAVCLMEDIGGVPRGQVPMRQADIVSSARVQAVQSAACERAAGRPLQYILGEWDFLNLTLKVGEGVLIPRADTEILCETVSAALRRQFPTEPTLSVWDLCAGSGCVGLGIASLCAGAVPTCVELSDDALIYLKANANRYPHLAATVVQADVLNDAVPSVFVHALVSNPPYIPTADLADLMREVQREPVMALDGSEDGLRFYRAILDRWLPCVLPRGICAVEIGLGQDTDVVALFKAAGLENVTVIQDLAGIPRVVMGYQPNIKIRRQNDACIDA